MGASMTRALFADNVLVLVPHPDDEVVGACAAISRAQSVGSHVLLAVLTDGVPDRATLWPWRRKHHSQMVNTRRLEAVEAAARLATPVG